MNSPALTRILVTLCVTEIISYGVLYYAFAVLAPAIARDTGWSGVAIATAFSVGSLTGAVVGIPVGRALQRYGPRPTMTVGSLIGGAGIALVAIAPTTPTFLAAWVIVGIGTTGLFYSPAFGALTGWFGAKRVAAITTLTLAAGFASTIFAPLTSTLDGWLGWRSTYLLLASLVLIVTLPAHFFGLRGPWPRSVHHAVRRDREILGSRAFILLTTAGTLTSLVSYASLVGLPVLLIGRGVSPALAAWAVGLSGAGQVVGRAIYPLLNRRLEPRSRTASIIGLLAACLAAQALISSPVWLMLTIAILTGSARGLFTLVNATFIADLWGPERYASVSGVYNAPVAAAGAIAPAIGAGVAVLVGGYPPLFIGLAGIGLIAAATAALAGQPQTSIASLPLEEQKLQDRS